MAIYIDVVFQEFLMPFAMSLVRTVTAAGRGQVPRGKR